MANQSTTHAKICLIIMTVFISSCATTPDLKGFWKCDGNATYSAVFTSSWSAETHPSDFPEKSHYSDLIGATHNNEVSFWSLGQRVTGGIKDVSELGINRKFIKEIEWAIKLGSASEVVHGPDLKNSPGSVEVSFQLRPEFSLITLLSMIAPSPDWFVGVSGIDMCENGSWVVNKTVALKVYDAGTDDGDTYTAEDRATLPKQAVSVLNSGIHTENGVIPQLATLTLKLTSSNQ